MSPLDLIYNSHSVALDHLIKNARLAKYKIHMLVYVNLFIANVSGEEDEVGLLDLHEHKIVDMPTALVDTKVGENIFKANNNLIYGETVRISVSAGACPDFNIDFETNRATGSFAMNKRPFFFDVPTQLIAGVVVEGTPVGCSGDVRSLFLNHIISMEAQDDKAPEPPKTKPKLTVVK